MLLLHFLTHIIATKSTQTWSSSHVATKMSTSVPPTTSYSNNLDVEQYLGLPTATETVVGVNTIQDPATGFHVTTPRFPTSDIVLFSNATNNDGSSKCITAAGWGCTPTEAVVVHTDMVDVVSPMLTTTGPYEKMCNIAATTMVHVGAINDVSVQFLVVAEGSSSPVLVHSSHGNTIITDVLANYPAATDQSIAPTSDSCWKFHDLATTAVTCTSRLRLYTTTV